MEQRFEPSRAARRAVALPCRAYARLTWLALWLAACAWSSGCAASRVKPHEPVPSDASGAMAEALELWRDADLVALEPALDAARSATRLAPDWVAPRRFIDDRLREELLGPNALEGHRAALAADPGDAVHLYLAGRLEGELGNDRMRAATRRDPALAWAEHGLGWKAFLDGRPSEALRRGKAALARARDPFERANFTSVLARYLRSQEEHPAAATVLQECLADEELSDRMRAWLLTELAMTELASDDPELRRRGVRRSLELIGTSPLSRAELEALVRGLRLPRRPVAVTYADVELALAQRALDPELSRPYAQHPTNALELALLERAGAPVGTARRLRGARFSYGDPARGVEAWRAELPAQVLDEDGLPRDTRLARIVLAARALDGALPEAATDARVFERVKELGEALIDGGWFREARSLAGRLPADRLAYAEDLRTRALAGRATLDAIADLLRNLPQERPRFPALVGERPEPGPAPAPERVEVRDLDALLAAMSAIFERAHRFLGDVQGEGESGASLAESPRVDYGWVGTLLHPGERFSAQDEELGRGTEGETVRGVAEEFRRLGRFAVIGDMALTRAPDGTVLQAVWVEERSGEHLGVPWSGTVAWCEGADFHGGAARSGAAIGGAALHEGYFVDLAVVRQEYERWRVLAARFSSPDGARRVSRALAVHGVPLADGESWRRADILLGEADRMRLAVMADRAQGDNVLGEVPLDAFVEVTAVHEEGHLCDRTRFYPASRHLWSLIGFAFSAGFHPARIAGDLEYRAQLVALCEVSDPRIAWTEILQAAESGVGGDTPHAAAYTRLLGDLLSELAAAWEADPLAWRELDPERLLGHQLHRLPPEKLRSLALTLARRRGLVADEARP